MSKKLNTYKVLVGTGDKLHGEFDVYAWNDVGAEQTAETVRKRDYPELMVVSIELVPNEVEELPDV